MKKDNKKEKKINFDKVKILKGIGVGAIVLIVLGLSFLVSKNYDSNVSSYEFNKITIDEYLALVDSDDASIVYVAMPGCGWCQKQTPILKKIAAENNLEVNYLDTTNFVYQTETGETAYSEAGLKFISTSERYKAEGYGTPNTIIVQNGTVVDGVFQYSDRNGLIELFERAGFISE